MNMENALVRVPNTTSIRTQMQMYQRPSMTLQDQRQTSSNVLDMRTVEQLTAIAAHNRCNVVYTRMSSQQTRENNSRNIRDSGNVRSDRRYYSSGGSAPLPTPSRPDLCGNPVSAQESSLLSDLGNLFSFIGTVLKFIWRFLIWIGTFFINYIRG